MMRQARNDWPRKGTTLPEGGDGDNKEFNKALCNARDNRQHDTSRINGYSWKAACC